MKKYPRKIGKWTSYGTFSETEKEWLKNPKVRKAVEALEPKFALIRAILNSRTKKGITQKKWDEMVGKKQSAIARFESGTYNPTLSFLTKLTNALGAKIKIEA